MLSLSLSIFFQPYKKIQQCFLPLLALYSSKSIEQLWHLKLWSYFRSYFRSYWFSFDNFLLPTKNSLQYFWIFFQNHFFQLSCSEAFPHFITFQSQASSSALRYLLSNVFIFPKKLILMIKTVVLAVWERPKLPEMWLFSGSPNKLSIF